MDYIPNYQGLANAIIHQAAKDFKSHSKYLSKHQKTDELVSKCDAVRKDRVRKIKAWKTRQRNKAAKDDNYVRQPVPEEYKIITDEEKELYAIIRHEAAVREIESFLRSSWFGELTELDGEVLLQNLRKVCV